MKHLTTRKKHNFAKPSQLALAVSLGLVATSSNALADEIVTAVIAPTPQEVISDLQQRILILERKLELNEEDTQTAKTSNATVAADGKGFKISSADGDYQLKIGGLLQADNRTYVGDKQDYNNITKKIPDGFLLRRAQLDIKGSLGKFIDFRINPEFAGSNSQGDSAALADAYVDLKFSPYANVRVGKQKVPLSFERLQSSSATAFNELGYAAELLPNRDIGISLFGNAFDKALNYQAGIYNGAPDGRDGVFGANDGRYEVSGRVLISPFLQQFNVLSGLSLGLAGSTTSNDTNATANANVAANNPAIQTKYRSSGQQTIFAYKTPSSTYIGAESRFVPQLSYYNNSFGLTGEYAIVKEQAINGKNQQTLRNKAYTVNVSYVLTGEDSTNGNLKPANPFKIGGTGWGAVELVGRVTGLNIDKHVFDTIAGVQLADSGKSVTKAQGLGIGLNWWLNQNLKITPDFSYTQFTGGNTDATGKLSNRPTEKALFTRLTYTF